MLASSRKPCHIAGPRRRAKSPALHCGRDRAAADERPLSVKHAGGPMRSSAPAQRRAAACHPRRCCMPALHCRAGVHARRKGLRRPGRILAGQGAAPLRLRRAAHPPPLAGEALPPVCPALQGGVTTPPGRVAPAQPLQACAGTAHPPCDTAMQGGRERAARNRQPSAGSGALPAEFSLPGPFRILPACLAPCACQTPAHGV